MPFRPFLQVTVLNGQGKWPFYPFNHQQQTHLSFTCIPNFQNHNNTFLSPVCHPFLKITTADSLLFKWMTEYPTFYLVKKIENTSFVFKLFFWQNNRHNKYITLFQIHHIISNKFRSWPLVAFAVSHGEHFAVAVKKEMKGRKRRIPAFCSLFGELGLDSCGQAGAACTDGRIGARIRWPRLAALDTAPPGSASAPESRCRP
jgi:hypothetical protein